MNSFSYTAERRAAERCGYSEPLSSTFGSRRTTGESFGRCCSSRLSISTDFSQRGRATMNPDLLIARAIDALDCAAPEHALGLLKQALALDPDCARGHSVLALVLLVQNRLHAAQLEAQIGLTLEPESSLSHLAVGQVAFAQRRFSAAVSALEQACALAPDDAEPRRVLAQTQWTLGQRGAAEANAQQALALAPDDAGVHATIAQFR